MKIAIPVWNGKISPVFDTASKISVFSVKTDGARFQYERTIRDNDLRGKCTKIKELSVDLLICGAISRHFKMMLSDSGVKIISWIAGSAEEVLEAFIKGTLSCPRFTMPGCDPEESQIDEFFRRELKMKVEE